MFSLGAGMTLRSVAIDPRVGTSEIPGRLGIVYEAITASPGPKFRSTEATSWTVTPPWTPGSPAPKLAIRIVGEITSPGWSEPGMSKPTTWRLGRAAVIRTGAGTR